MPTPADIEAMLDVLDDICNDSDAATFDEAVELMDGLERVKAGAAVAIDLLKMQMLSHLEDGGPRTIGDRTFKPIDDNVKRFDHDEILRIAAIQAFMDENGEIRSPGEAVEILAETVKDLYLAPSTKAKLEAIDRLGVARDSVIEIERKGRKVFIRDNTGKR